MVSAYSDGELRGGSWAPLLRYFCLLVSGLKWAIVFTLSDWSNTPDSLHTEPCTSPASSAWSPRDFVLSAVDCMCTHINTQTQVKDADFFIRLFKADLFKCICKWSITYQWRNELLKVIWTDTDRSATYDFLLTFYSNHGPISYYFTDKRRLLLKIAKFSHPMYFAPLLKGFPLELGTGLPALMVKKN